MLTNSRDIVRRLEREGWIATRVVGSHHVFKHPTTGQSIVVPHPKKDLGKGLVRAPSIKAQAGRLTEVRHGSLYRHYRGSRTGFCRWRLVSGSARLHVRRR
ncbi:MAG: type II toxin-antitoxin system HicA family toxin [Bradyrhizobiaceae bacterium]|nr:MAG: type II toxin-antitoxin system HicA family toxin [Bradyrhizobiaceae bacterium]